MGADMATSSFDASSSLLPFAERLGLITCKCCAVGKRPDMTTVSRMGMRSTQQQLEVAAIAMQNLDCRAMEVRASNYLNCCVLGRSELDQLDIATECQ